MALAHGFDINSAQGVIFALDTNARHSRIQTFGDWEVELRKGSAFACAKNNRPHSDESLFESVGAAHEAVKK